MLKYIIYLACIKSLSLLNKNKSFYETKSEKFDKFKNFEVQSFAQNFHNID